MRCVLTFDKAGNLGSSLDTSERSSSPDTTRNKLESEAENEHRQCLDLVDHRDMQLAVG